MNVGNKSQVFVDPTIGAAELLKYWLYPSLLQNKVMRGPAAGSCYLIHQ